MDNSVSVIIPTWNRVESLERAILSCLSQTVSVLEIIVCDDGSSDGTELRVKGFADPRVVWCPGERGGRPAIPRNRGILQSKGEWIAFLDDDDEWLPEKLEKQIECANVLDCLAACSNAYRVFPGDHARKPLLNWPHERIRLKDLVECNHIVCSSVLIHRSLLGWLGSLPESSRLIVGEDYAYWLRVATHTDFAFVKEPMLLYQDDPENSIRKLGPTYRAQLMRVWWNFGKWALLRRKSFIYFLLAFKKYSTLLLEEMREVAGGIAALLKAERR